MSNQSFKNISEEKEFHRMDQLWHAAKEPIRISALTHAVYGHMGTHVSKEYVEIMQKVGLFEEKDGFYKAIGEPTPKLLLQAIRDKRFTNPVDNSKIKRENLYKVYDAIRGHMTSTQIAKKLGIGYTTFYKKNTKYYNAFALLLKNNTILKQRNGKQNFYYPGKPRESIEEIMRKIETRKPEPETRGFMETSQMVTVREAQPVEHQIEPIKEPEAIPEAEILIPVKDNRISVPVKFSLNFEGSVEDLKAILDRLR